MGLFAKGIVDVSLSCGEREREIDDVGVLRKGK